MAISQSRYAAQVVDRDGVALKFDDIGCMRRYLREHQPAQARIYVMDYVNQQWLAAEAAVYVRSKTIESPMASGLAAFRDQPAASRFLRENDGALTSFPELMTRESGATQHADQHR